MFLGVEFLGKRNRIDWNDIARESIGVLDILEDTMPTITDIGRPKVVRIELLIPLPPAVIFFPGAVASSFSFTSSRTLEVPSPVAGSFGLTLRLIIKGKRCITKQSVSFGCTLRQRIRRKRGMPRRLASPDSICQSYYIGDIDDDGNSGDNAGAGEDFSREAASEVGPVVLS